ncbi:hypothetical protein NLI96_g11511 [Meripilus lineatus]|uniref:Steroid 5-alpha reductase C-terminal domain-containing protein n=1 Tax=Meripilus lineatus TaxID=2056292 RepID=A0AAD5UU30_9APHY|nr:hypothetical protein NLI96_g11511 [Physisporinus lineatus]
MAPVHVLDKYYLSITLLVTIGYQLLGFAIAWTLQISPEALFQHHISPDLSIRRSHPAILTLLIGNTFHTWNVVASVLVMVWATRLAGFLLFRVLKTGSDTRFDEIRSHFFKFFGFWVGQILWVWTVSLPVTILNSPAVSDVSQGGSDPSFGTARDIIGIILWGIGWLIETVADAQKFRYKSSRPPKDRPTTIGIWSWSRHPPYFGEILCWWGIWTLCLSPTTNGSLPSSARAAQYGSVVSPIFTFLILMFASGVPTAEKPTAKKFYLLSHAPADTDTTSASRSPSRATYPDAWNKYKAYLNSTSILIPIPPVIYRPLPKIVKRTILLDWPIYQFDEVVDGKAARDEAGR